MSEKKNPIITGRARLENIKGDKEKDKFDSVVEYMKMHVKDGKKGRYVTFGATL